jgi:uncharacterized protein (TIGR02145 family)
MKRIFKSALLILVGCSLFINCEKNNNKGLPVDGDGNVYNTVAIGTQVWLTENLKTTKYALGAPISLVTDNKKWETCQVAAYCWYNNNESLKDTYGALYNYDAVKIGLLCPIGYHVPTYEDWTTLFDYLGGPDIAAIKLKESGTIHWNYSSPTNLGTNVIGFTALPGGYRTWWGEFQGINTEGYWWISDKRDIIMSSANEGVLIGGIGGQPGFSVRCIKDK